MAHPPPPLKSSATYEWCHTCFNIKNLWILLSQLFLRKTHGKQKVEKESAKWKKSQTFSAAIKYYIVNQIDASLVRRL